ncbi:MAG TPA: CPBP family intramembrane glutamic endopeptidase, partial [Bacillales bacterium]|nr:CPBP family intramembrane glutamic endopeptidase [Bacillales bacterium]
MPQRYWWVVATYVIMQLSGLVAAPMLLLEGLTKTQAVVIWSVFSFSAALIIILILLRKDMRESRNATGRAPVDQSILWAVLGILLALGAQVVSSMIESALGVNHASQNTEIITEITRKMPIFILIAAIIGPILEEVVFRKIIFGSLNKRFDFAIAAVVSSLIFGLAHREIPFLLSYTSMGFVFAFLYAKTKRILVPIVAHASMNTFVVLIQVIFYDDLKKYMQHLKDV